MKKTDIAMIILIAVASVTIAFFVTRSILGDATEQKVKVDTIEAIDSTVAPVDTSIFNSEAINPAVEVQIDAPAQ